ncbi:MAG: hypothetical protein II738_07705 [Clostridia bacterium]|nr:hypothetical protein [Clostridia bacterium]
MKILRFFLIGVAFGVAAQLLGELTATPLGRGMCNLSVLGGNLDVYPLIIVLLLLRKTAEPKAIAGGVLLFFAGLCLGYYGYTTAFSAVAAVRMHDPEMFATNALSDLVDGLAYTALGAMAALWCYVAKRLRNRGKRLLYGCMLAPFFAVTVMMVVENARCVVPNVAMMVVDVLCLAAMVAAVWCSEQMKPTEETV